MSIFFLFASKSSNRWIATETVIHSLFLIWLGKMWINEELVLHMHRHAHINKYVWGDVCFARNICTMMGREQVLRYTFILFVSKRVQQMVNFPCDESVKRRRSDCDRRLMHAKHSQHTHTAMWQQRFFSLFWVWAWRSRIKTNRWTVLWFLWYIVLSFVSFYYSRFLWVG